MRHIIAGTILAVAGAACVCAVCVYKPANVRPEVSEAPEVPMPRVATFAYTPAPETPHHAIFLSPPRTHESKALAFELSATSTEPRRRFDAYELAHGCALAHVLSESARTASWLPGRPAEPVDLSACGDLKPGQWDDVERRHALLREASLAGVHGSWFRVWQEGPYGPLRTLSDGPEYHAWESQARVAALASGDPFVYAQEAQEWRDKDPQRALVATVIYRETMTRRVGGASFDPGADPEVMELASTLDKAMAAKAIATGRAFVASVTRP